MKAATLYDAVLLGRQLVATQLEAGSIPVCVSASVAQLEELLFCNQAVGGSSPFRGSQSQWVDKIESIEL